MEVPRELIGKGNELNNKLTQTSVNREDLSGRSDGELIFSRALLCFGGLLCFVSVKEIGNSSREWVFQVWPSNFTSTFPEFASYEIC